MLPESELAHLADVAQRLAVLAHERGLQPFPIEYELVPAAIMYEFGAYGIPGRFTHWSHGRDFWREKASYDRGQSKIYELIINANPARAYLLDTNTRLANTFVIAHCLGHSDFFAQNAHFAATRRDMLEGMDRDAARLRAHAARYGAHRVERLLDAALALERHSHPDAEGRDALAREDWRVGKDAADTRRDLRARGPFDDLLGRGPAPAAPAARAPVAGDDLLYVLAAHSPALDDWERDVLDIVRREWLYFLPQARTKIANEGWAVFWHLRLLRALGLPAGDALDVAALHAGVARPHPGGLNPYHLGWQLFESLNRANGGGDDDCAPACFAARAACDDVALVRNFLTPELARELDLLLYVERDQTYYVDAQVAVDARSEEGFARVRDGLANALAARGVPAIRATASPGGYLLLEHTGDDGRDPPPLDLPYAEKTIEMVEALWGDIIYLTTPDPTAPPNSGKMLKLRYNRSDGHSRAEYLLG